MITKTRARNSDLSDFFAVDQLPKPSVQMKQKLMEMAKNKEDRPHWKSKEGVALHDYTIKSSGSYCEKFDKLIRVETPLWFVSQTQSANQMKQKLTEMAKNKEARPKQKTKEGTALCCYTNKSSKCYCEKFDKLIRVETPLWFVPSSVQMKQKLMEMAKNKEARPKTKTKEGVALNNYTIKSSGSYCEKFDKLIRVETPLWFVSRSYRVKQKLIQMAKNKEARPRKNTKEGRALSNYTNKSSDSYCEKFDKLIRVEAPDWFLASVIAFD